MAGQGEAGAGGAGNGDLYLEIKLAAHKFFEIKEDDSYCEIPVSLSEAILGAEINVPTINGNSVIMKIPPETQNGRNFRLFRARNAASKRRNSRTSICKSKNCSSKSDIKRKRNFSSNYRS